RPSAPLDAGNRESHDRLHERRAGHNGPDPSAAVGLEGRSVTVSHSASQELEQRTVRRVAARLMPFLLLLYLIAYLDRANVSFAGLRMTQDLGFSDRVFGLATGLFYVGYVLLEIPGSLLVESWSARRWFARIMISWGLCSAACGLIHTRAAFYTLRLL